MEPPRCGSRRKDVKRWSCVAIALLVSTPAISACSKQAEQTESGVASCDMPLGVTFEGRDYLGDGRRGEAERGIRLGTGAMFSCASTPPTVVVYAVRGRPVRATTLREASYGVMERSEQLEGAE